MQIVLDKCFQHVSNFFGHVKDLMSSISGIFIVAGSAFITLSDTMKGMVLFLFVCLLDVITGAFASWIENRRERKPIKVYSVESELLRNTIPKLIAYFFLIIVSWIFTLLFFNVPFNIPYSTKDLFVVDVMIGLCIAIESHSNVENFKRAGFDVYATIGNIAKKTWSLFRVVKTGRHE